MRRPDIHLHIENIILHGLDDVNRKVLHEALTEELSRLLTSSDYTAETLFDSRIPKLDGGSISASAQPDSFTLGTQIAQIIVGGLTV